jgi:hypothetical protein
MIFIEFLIYFLLILYIYIYKRQPYWWVMLYEQQSKVSSKIINFKKKVNLYSSYEGNMYILY